jgi:shikimate dehydrogenase
MTATGSALLAGVIGWPVSHSLSPQLHGYWLSEYGIDGAFVPLAVKREDFSYALRGLRLSGLRGLSVTVPHKEAAFALAHHSDEEANAAGAANLLLFGHDGRYEARNTDTLGLVASLIESLGEGFMPGKAAVLLGAGGAARAAVRALDRLGASQIRIVNRNEARAEGLVRELSLRTKAALAPFSFARWAEAATGAALFVNATSAGMKGNPALDLPLEPLSKTTVVCDLVYNPLQTALLKKARARGHPIVDGLGMLMHQAVPAFEAFFGRKPDVTPKLRRKLEKALADV